MIVPLISQIEVEFIIDTLEYLHKGGRCSSVQHFIGSLLKIRPIVKVIDGAMISTDKVRGKREKALLQLLDNALAQKDIMDTEFLFVTHSLASEEAAYVKQQIEQQTKVNHVHITEAGCVISSHCGPLTVGIVFAKK
ncbi:EDD domain protein, DegV family [Paenibacillus sp. yr247]|uniref:DegV family protein n=1 Tax=Paenibacillus sp. yr247 TaxID=1761880 RepID=UPI0008851BAD|nr:DegV family protein [Paenibacillus sp. yr247]SDN76170.1 EDD domain protein, DegV family [Paenibacillus sp. yr247]